MTDIERPRTSHSAYEDYATCGQLYYLKRIVKVPVRPGVPQVAGSAFHLACDHYDKGASVDLVVARWPEILEDFCEEKENDTQTSRDTWRVSAKGKETIEHWRDVLGPDLITRYATWRDGSEWTIARGLPPDINGNTDGVEYAVLYPLGGVDVLGYIDRVEIDKLGNYGVVDLKTWNRRRPTAQLPGYVYALQRHGVKATWATYYEARKGSTWPDPPKFHAWDTQRVSMLYEQAEVMRAAGFYLPRPGDHCGWCDVRSECEYAL